MAGETIESTFRDFTTLNVPSSGKHEPRKSEIRNLLNAFLGQQTGANAGALIQTSKSALDALSPAANTMAWVIGDSNPDLDGVYQRSGSSWVKRGPLPYSVIQLNNADAGTANAIQVTTAVGIPSAAFGALYILNVTQENTGAVTVSINGATAKPLISNTGSPLLAGAITAGMALLCVDDGTSIRLLVPGDIDAIIAAAEALLAAAEAIAGNAYTFNTEADFVASNIPGSVQSVRTVGYYEPGDGGGHVKVRSTALDVFAKQSADGAWWVPASGQDIHVEMFGARRYSADDLVTLGRTSEACHEQVQEALDFRFATGGGVVYAMGQFYVWEAGVRPKRCTGIKGAGHGAFPPSFPTEPKTWEGTNILLRGPSFPKETLEFGVTSMKVAGGHIADPNNAGRIFKLASLSEDDASGSTPATTKQLAIGLMNADYDAPWYSQDFRICPWIGDDGFSDYSLTTGSDLGDEIDICMCLNDTEHGLFTGLQTRGYPRLYGFLILSAGYSREARCEGNILRKVSAQGHTGFGIRAGDIWAVQATTASTLEIRWSDESYWPASGAFEGLQNGTDYTYTSLSRNGNNLVFNGVSPDPSGTTQIRNPLRGTGFSTTLLDSCEGWALYHHSGQTAEELGLEISKGGESSGFPMRGIHGVNNSFFGEDVDAICFYFHDSDDMDLLGGKFEIGYLIASPLDNAAATTRNPLAVAPAGSTSNLRFGSYTSNTTNRALFKPRSVNDMHRQFNPVDLLSGDFLLRALTDQDWIARQATGKSHIVESATGADLWTVTSSGNGLLSGQLTLGGSGAGFLNAPSGQQLNLRSGSSLLMQLFASGVVGPGADNTQNFGTSILRWATIFAGTGAINTSDEDDKDGIETIPDAVLDAWGEVQWCQFRFKGRQRLHTGLVAQRVMQAFERHGLDGFAYGLLCYDEWEDQYEDVQEERDVLIPVYDADGVATGEFIKRREMVLTGEQRLVAAAGKRFGIRYDEALAMEAAYQRRELDRLKVAGRQ